MIHYSHLSHWLRTPTPIRQVVNPYDWITKLSRVLVQEPWCRTGESICNGDIASTVMRGIDLRLFREPSLNLLVAALDKYAEAPGSLGDEARYRVLLHCADLQQHRNHPLTLMAEEGQSMKSGVLNNSGAVDWPSAVQYQRILSGITEISTTPETPNSSAYPRPSSSMASHLIARSNRFTPPPYHGKVSAAEPLPTVDTSRSSLGCSYAPAPQPVLFGGGWPVHYHFRRNRAALPTIPEASMPVAERAKETPNWLWQTAQLVAQMSCQSITSEQVLTGIYSAVGGCLTVSKECQTPVASEITVQPHSSSRR